MAGLSQRERRMPPGSLRAKPGPEPGPEQCPAPLRRLLLRRRAGCCGWCCCGGGAGCSAALLLVCPCLALLTSERRDAGGRSSAQLAVSMWMETAVEWDGRWHKSMIPANGAGCTVARLRAYVNMSRGGFQTRPCGLRHSRSVTTIRWPLAGLPGRWWATAAACSPGRRWRGTRRCAAQPTAG